MHVNSALRRSKAIGVKADDFKYGSVELPNMITTAHAETPRLMEVMRIVVSHVQINLSRCTGCTGTAYRQSSISGTVWHTVCRLCRVHL